MHMTDIDFKFLDKFIKAFGLNKNRNAQVFQFLDANSSSQSTARKHLKAGLVQILAEYLQGFLRSTNVKLPT
jgi:hypothetical protein